MQAQAELKRALDRFPALAPCAGAIMSALAFIEWTWIWMPTGLLAILMLTVGRRHYFWFCFGILVTIISGLLNAPRQLGLEYFYSTRDYTCEVQKARVGANSLRVDVEVLDAGGAFPLRINVMGVGPDILPGDTLQFRGCLRPVNTNNIINRHYVDRSVPTSASVSLVPNQIRVTGHSQRLRYLPDRIGIALRNWIERSSLTDRTCNLLTDSLLGSNDGPIEDLDVFRTIGIAHLLCVSGFHVGLIFMLVEFLLWPLVLWPGLRRWRPLIILPAIWMFVMITGAAAPAVRAGIMVSLLVMSRLLERDRMSLNSLYVALCIIVWLSPWAVFSLGLWIGCAAVAALITATRLMNPFRPGTKIFSVASVVAGCAVATIATLPIQMVVFHTASFYSVIANILVVPVFPVFINCGLVVAALQNIGCEASWLVWITENIADYFYWVGNWLYERPGSLLTGIHFTTVGTWMLFGSMLALWGVCLFKGWKGKALSVNIGLSLLVAITLLSEPTVASEVIFENDCCVVADADKLDCFVFGTTASPADFDYFKLSGGHSHHNLSLHPNPRYALAGGDTIHFVGTNYNFDANLNGHIVFVRSNSRATIDSLITHGIRPARIVLSDKLKPQHRLRLRNHFAGQGVAVHDLWLEPLVLNP